MPATQLKVLIAGAGIGGLVAGLALLERGATVEVFEQATSLTEPGAGVQLSANGTRVLIALGIERALKPFVCEASGKEIRLYSTGQTWKLFDLGSSSLALYGAPYWMVHRGDLHQVLADTFNRWAPGRLHLGMRCTDFDETESAVQLHFDDGSTMAGQVLIGADGIHSVIRSKIGHDPRPFFTGLAAWRGVVSMDRLPRRMRRNVGANWVGPAGHVVTYPLRGGTLLNFVGVFESDSWTSESWTERGTVDECLACLPGWNDEIRTVIRNVDTPYKWALLAREPLRHFSTKRATLLGDAAHPALPFLAQGANMAIEDGMVLARCLAAYEPSDALSRYDMLRVDRTTAVVTGSSENAKRFQDPVLARTDRAAAYITSEWQPGKVHQRYDWLFNYNALAVTV